MTTHLLPTFRTRLQDVRDGVQRRFGRIPSLRRLLADMTGIPPMRLALSFAVGTFVSVLPTPGGNVLIAGALAAATRRVERGPLFAALAVWNSAVVAPLYPLGARLGTALLDDWQRGAAAGWLNFLVGTLALAAGMAAASFVAVLLWSACRRRSGCVGLLGG